MITSHENRESSWFENHQPQKTKIPTVIYPPVIQNLNQMAATFTVTTSFPRVVFSTPVIFKATSKLFGSQGCSDDKNWLDFSSIFFKICRFRSSILLSLQVLFSEERRSRQVWHAVARFFSTNRNSLLRTVTNGIALFCIDNRLRQMTFFRVRQSGQRRGN